MSLVNIQQLQPQAVPTMAEIFAKCFVVQMHERKDLAFVYDEWGESLLATLERPGRHRCLPNLPYSPAAGFETVGPHRLWTSLQVPRALAAWLNRCRDTGAVLTIAGEDFTAWWQDGVRRLRPDDVGQVLGEP
jgi:hypothetical protein